MCAKNVSTFCLFLPKSNNCRRKPELRHLLSTSITPPGRILTLTSSPHVHPLNGSEARNSLSDRTSYDQPKFSNADFATTTNAFPMQQGGRRSPPNVHNARCVRNLTRNRVASISYLRSRERAKERCGQRDNAVALVSGRDTRAF